MNCRILRAVLSVVLACLTWLGHPTFAFAAVAANQPATEAPATEASEAVPAPATSPQPSLMDWYAELNALSEKAVQATNDGDFPTAEGYWTQMIEKFPRNPAIWSNRGNSKVSQNKLDSALKDYAKAIELAPDAPDPYINQGAALEGLNRLEEAIASYNKALELDPQDPAAYNNRGNAEARLEHWEAAIADFQHATALAPKYTLAQTNYAIALYQTGKIDDATRALRNLVRKYPQFADARAALTAALWNQGRQGEAESQWVSVMGLDSRYKNLEWVKNVRHWPSKLVAALDKFLNLQ